MSRGQYNSPTPLGTQWGAAYLGELLANPEPVEDLLLTLETDERDDVEFQQEQLALAAIVVQMADPSAPYVAAEPVAAALRDDPDASALVPAAHACVNRLLNNPYAPLWAGHTDGGINIRRKARSLVTRLHRTIQ